jgi:hypothetical protein
VLRTSPSHPALGLILFECFLHAERTAALTEKTNALNEKTAALSKTTEERDRLKKIALDLKNATTTLKTQVNP